MPPSGPPPRPHHLLQPRDLLVQPSDVLFDDVGELLDLHRFVVKEGFAFGQDRQLLQFSEGVAEVLPNAFGHEAELAALPRGSVALNPILSALQ